MRVERLTILDDFSVSLLSKDGGGFLNQSEYLNRIRSM